MQPILDGVSKFDNPFNYVFWPGKAHCIDTTSHESYKSRDQVVTKVSGSVEFTEFDVA